MELVVAIAAGLVVAVGLVLTVVPVAPGLLVVWLAGLAYGLATGWSTAAWWAMGAMTALAAAGFAAAVSLPGRGATTRGAPASTLAAGAAGALVGALVLPALGLPIGGVAGIWLAELARQGDAERAWRVTVGVLKGLGVAALAQLAAGLLMALVWLAWVVVELTG